MSSFPNPIAPMNTQQRPRRLPKIKFRVLIIGRANAGKTSILQRVCDTTESPVIYERTGSSEEQTQLKPSTERSEHTIENEIIFSNHDGYIFHDSRGFESGDKTELEIVQNFVRQKSGEKRLASRLHAIWYCIPMDNQRGVLDLKHFKDICPDQNVPVIGVFTKYDQFKRNVKMELEDHGDPDKLGTAAPERWFKEHYLCHLGDGATYVKLERMHKPDGSCKNLIEKTAEALKDDVVALMLVAVQNSNVELSVKVAVKWICPHFGCDAKDIVKKCMVPFPYIWLYDLLDHDLLYLDLLDDNLLDLLHDDNHLTQIMTMSIMKQLFLVNSRYHLMTATIIILKHATTLRLSGISAQSALCQAELGYQKLNIGAKIMQHFTAPHQEYSAQDFVDFIMGVSL